MLNVNIEFQILPMGEGRYKSYPLPVKEEEDRSRSLTLDDSYIPENLTVDYFQAEKGEYFIPTTTA